MTSLEKRLFQLFEPADIATGRAIVLKRVWCPRVGQVHATIDGDDGETQEVRARYLVGCDGAGSFVREKLGITMTGNPVLTYTTNVVFRSRDLERLQDIKLAYRYIFVDEEGTWATLVAIDGRDQFRFSLVGGRD